MEQLAPLLELLAADASGGELFDAHEPLRHDTAKPVVCCVKMPTGIHTNQIDEGRALKSVLYDNQHPGLESALADIVQCFKDSANQQLCWGLSSFEALDRLTGVSFTIPVSRDGSKERFTMSRPHALDGFHVDILNFVHERPVERHLWEVLAALGAPPLSGQYTQVSEAFGARGSRYRLFFNSDVAPQVFTSGGRLIDEIIFMGQNYRVYGKGWYSHKKGYQRIDLDIAAKEKRISKPTSPSPRQTARPSGTSKRACVQSPQPTPWVSVPRQPSSRHAPGSVASARPWTSPNMFDALREHIVVAPAQSTNKAGDASMIFPSILSAPDAPVICPSNTYVGGTKPVGHSVTRVEMSLDAILEEFTLLDAKTAAARAAFDSSGVLGDARIAFNLAELIEVGDADRVHQYLQSHPIQFGRKLTALATSRPDLLLHLVHLQVLCRWMRAAWGTALPFGQLYNTVFHHAFSLQSLAADFAALAGSSTLADYKTDDIGDECLVQCTDTDVIFALAEVVMAYMAPLFYTSDAALNATLAGPVFSIPARDSSRYLSSATLHQVLMRSTLGEQIWSSTKVLIQRFYTSCLSGSVVGDPTAANALHDLASVYAGWTRDMDKMVTLDQSFSLDIAASKQPMVDPSTNALTQGDLEELWTDTATPLDG